MPQVYVKSKRAQPTQLAEDTQTQLRSTQYGELVVVPLTEGTYGLCDEGAYFKATNPTPSTGIAHALQQTFSDTANVLFTLFNNDSEGAKRIYLDYVKLMLVSATPTAATSIEAAIKIDNTNRFSTGGTAITPKNANMDSSQATISVLNFGAVTATAASGAVRLLSRQRFPHRVAPALVQGDCLFFNFGTQDAPALNPVGSATPATAPSFFMTQLGPAIIGGGDTLLFHLWYPAIATTAPSYEFEIGWWER